MTLALSLQTLPPGHPPDSPPHRSRGWGSVPLSTLSPASGLAGHTPVGGCGRRGGGGSGCPGGELSLALRSLASGTHLLTAASPGQTEGMTAAAGLQPELGPSWP